MIRPGRELVSGNSSWPIEGQYAILKPSREETDLSWRMIASRHYMDINRAVRAGVSTVKIASHSP